MSTSRKIILKKDHRNPQFGFLKLQTITNRKAKEKSLKIKIRTKNWSAKNQKVYSTEPNAAEHNKKIEAVLSQGEVKGVRTAKKKSLIDFAEMLLPIIPIESTRESKRYALKKLKEFLKKEGKDDLLFSEVNLSFIIKYYNFLKVKCQVSLQMNI